MAASISFDRAADYYDETRALPDRVARRLISAIFGELEAVHATTVLEVGVGTGRVARPLAGRGIRVVGVDIAPRMLRRLRDQLQWDRAPPELILGDATALPIRSGSFRAALMFHVVHLIVPWDRALDEVRRVLVPGGTLIRDDTRHAGQENWAASVAKWDELMAARGQTMRARPSVTDIHAKLTALGGSCWRKPYAEARDGRTPEENLERIRNRVDSWTWEIADDVFADCFAEFEGWYRRHYRGTRQKLGGPVSYGVEIWTFQSPSNRG